MLAAAWGCRCAQVKPTPPECACALHCRELKDDWPDCASRVAKSGCEKPSVASLLLKHCYLSCARVGMPGLLRRYRAIKTVRTRRHGLIDEDTSRAHPGWRPSGLRLHSLPCWKRAHSVTDVLNMAQQHMMGPFRVPEPYCVDVCRARRRFIMLCYFTYSMITLIYILPRISVYYLNYTRTFTYYLIKNISFLT